MNVLLQELLLDRFATIWVFLSI